MSRALTHTRPQKRFPKGPLSRTRAAGPADAKPARSGNGLTPHCVTVTTASRLREPAADSSLSRTAERYTDGAGCAAAAERAAASEKDDHRRAIAHTAARVRADGDAGATSDPFCSCVLNCERAEPRYRYAERTK